MTSLLPLIEPPEPQTAARGDTSRLYREIQWDDQTNRPVWRGGNPVWVTGAAAVKSWILMTLYTVRQSKDLFSPDYGCDLANLVGQPFSDTVRQSEAVRLIRECLMINPYITDVQQITCDFSGSTVEISCIVATVYGEVVISK